MKNYQKKTVRLRRAPIIIQTTPKEPAAIYMPKWLIKFIIIIGILIGIFYVLFISPYLQIKQVEIKGAISPEAKAYILSQKGKNIFFIKSDNLQLQVRNLDQEIRSINIYRGLPDMIRVEIKTRGPVLIWNSHNIGYLVDDFGVAFRQTEEGNTTWNDLPIVVDRHNMPIKLGQKVVSLRLINFIQAFQKDFKSKIGINLKDWEIGETSIHAEAVTETGWRILTDTTRSPIYQLDDLAKIYAKHRAEIREYVDLRVSGYGYYK